MPNDINQLQVNATLSLVDWQNVLNLLEVGIKTVGATAFVPGGTLLMNLKEQIEQNADNAINNISSKSDTNNKSVV